MNLHLKLRLHIGKSTLYILHIFVQYFLSDVRADFIFRVIKLQQKKKK